MAAPVLLVGCCGWRGISAGGGAAVPCCWLAAREGAWRGLGDGVCGGAARGARAVRGSVLGGERCCHRTGLRQNPAGAVVHCGRNAGLERDSG